MGELKTYQGSCHCGAVRFEVSMDLGERIISCNCSICSRTGTLLGFVPVAQFTLRSGEDSLTDYQFGKQRLHHPFCKVCGVRAFSKGVRPDGGEMRAINVRCLEGVDPSQLQITPFDGAKL